MRTRSDHSLSRAVFFSLFVLTPFTPHTAHGEDEQSPSKDFSKTNSVTLLLADAQRRGVSPSNGLSHAFWEKDGRTTMMEGEGVVCRCLSMTEEGRSKGYLYFSIDPTFKEQDVAKVKIDVEYFDGFDGQPGVFGLQYDARGSMDAIDTPYKPCPPNVPLKGSGKWLKATFHVRDATFRNSQNARSDFRLVVSPPELCVRRVSVTLEPQAPVLVPLKFDKAGEAKLSEWNTQWDYSDKPSFSSQTNTTNGLRWLEIRAPGTESVGSWRTVVLLEPGEYQFVGRAKMEGVQTGGVMLRASGKLGYKMVSEAAAWTPLIYDFTMTATDYAELICDFRSNQGAARFDLDSLKLVRKNYTPP